MFKLAGFKVIGKRQIIEFDKKFLGGLLLRIFHSITIGSTLDNEFDYRFVVHYQKNSQNILSNLCDKYGSDKGQVVTDGHPYMWPAHTYTDYYSRLFDHCRLSVNRVFECGLGTNNPEFAGSMLEKGRPGASLRVWREYFPNSQVFGADIDSGVLFNEDRIKTFYVDQLDVNAILSMWKNIDVADFDLIIDDGLHTYEGGLSLFKHSFDKLKPGGIYVIEDVPMETVRKFRKYFLNNGVRADYVNLLRPLNGLNDNSLIVIRRPA